VECSFDPPEVAKSIFGHRVLFWHLVELRLFSYIHGRPERVNHLAALDNLYLMPTRHLAALQLRHKKAHTAI
jgi:hypothetical protein